MLKIYLNIHTFKITTDMFLIEKAKKLTIKINTKSIAIIFFIII